MDKQQAQQIIKETFEAPFDKGRFTGFIKNLLNRIDDAPFTYQGNYIPDAYRQYIRTLERIAKFSDGENSIDILVITLLKETSLERARTMQRNFVAWYLNGSRGGEMKDAALVAYVSPDKEDWRFSLVKMDYKFEKTATGKTKVKEEFTPARRWSFLVGKSEKSHTAQSRLVNILADDEHAPTLQEIEKAFDIETVTREFFLKYRELFLRTKEALDKLVNNNPKIKADFEAKGVDTVNFAKKLLGQIVFLYFLQKKGWFGVGRDAEWGTGSKQFLRELFGKKHLSAGALAQAGGDNKNFFNDILEPLFYEALRVGEERKQDDYYYSRFNCKIPFLNGGLFDPIGNYDWVHTDVNLPDKVFSNINKTKEGDIGDGILDVFDRYNFTVKEDEPLEKEVAIDPELLGKAYEKFNAIRPDNFDEYKKALKSGKKGDESKFNKQFGVYYTPREIVHYMCRESLINYLFTELSDCHSGPVSEHGINSDRNPDPTCRHSGEGRNPVVSSRHSGEDRNPDPTCRNSDENRNSDPSARHSGEGRNPEVSREDIEALIHLGEHVSENEARVLSKGKETRTYFHQLSESIRKNAKLIDDKLADITVCDPAVGSGAFPVGMMSEIVKTRNVLSTFINPPSPSDKGEITTTSPIEKGGIEGGSRTSYDFKRRCIEHSLYGVDIDPGAVEIAKLRLWLSLVVDEDDIKQIKPLPNLDYKIVCGNSLLGYPYTPTGLDKIEKLKQLFFTETNPTRKNELRSQIDDAIYSLYKNTEKSLGYKVTMDFKINFSEVFHEKGGFDVVIANPPYITIGLGKKQKFFSEKEVTTLKNLFADVFEYKGNTFALFLSKAIRLLNTRGVLTYIIPNTLLLNSTFEKARKYILKTSDVNILLNFKDSIFEGAETGGNLIIVLDKHKEDNRKTKVLGLRNLEHFAEHTNYNFIEQELFKEDDGYRFNIESTDDTLINKITSNTIPLGNIVKFYQGIITGDNDKFIVKNKSQALHEPILRGRDINKYYYSFDNNFVLFDPKKLWSNTNEKMFRVKEKIINRQTGSLLIGAYDNKGYFSLDSTHVQILIDQNYNLKYILALFNSKLLNYYYNNKVNESGRVFAQIKIVILKTLPIKTATVSEQAPFITLVDRILETKRIDPLADTSVWEREIDQMVYQLYDLTPEEIKIVEGDK